MITGPILALDLARTTGFAIGRPGDVPRSGSVSLKGGANDDLTYWNMMAFLRDTFVLDQPEMIAVEAPLPLEATRSLGNSEDHVQLARGLVAVVRGMKYGNRIPHLVLGNVQTVRKHFTGRARWGARDQGKRAVIDRCHALGLMPNECRDDNRADAIALHDWASATYGRKSAASFQLFAVPA